MKRSMKWALSFCLLTGAIHAVAQATVVGYTTLEYDAQTNTMVGDCTMNPSYATLAYYDPETYCDIYEGTTFITGASGPTNVSTPAFTPNAGDTYTAYGLYYLFFTYETVTYIFEYPNLYEEINGLDEYYYSYYEDNGDLDFPPDEYTWDGEEEPVYVPATYVFLGQVPSNQLTTIQHSYPNNPLPRACWITAFYDATRLTGPHHALDLVFDNGSGTGGQVPAIGTPVYAMEAGTVVATMSGQPNAPYPACMSTTPCPPGDYVKIRADGDSYTMLYFHMTPLVSVGQHVAAGQEIGTLDGSGCQSNPHLHVGRKDPNGNSVNFTIPCTNPYPTTKFDDGTTEDNDPEI